MSSKPTEASRCSIEWSHEQQNFTNLSDDTRTRIQVKMTGLEARGSSRQIEFDVTYDDNPDKKTTKTFSGTMREFAFKNGPKEIVVFDEKRNYSVQEKKTAKALNLTRQYSRLTNIEMEEIFGVQNLGGFFMTSSEQQQMKDDKTKAKNEEIERSRKLNEEKYTLKEGFATETTPLLPSDR